MCNRLVLRSRSNSTKLIILWLAQPVDEVAPFGRRACFFYYFCFFFVVYPLFCFLPSLSIHSSLHCSFLFFFLAVTSSLHRSRNNRLPAASPPPLPFLPSPFLSPFLPSARSYSKILQDRRVVPLAFAFLGFRSNTTNSNVRKRPFPLRNERQYVSRQ